ncbi:hypothetical protein D3C79_1085480 [compost metagenome]
MIASAIAIADLASISKPLVSSITICLQPGTFVVIIGNPQDAASINDLGSPSRYEGRHAI